MKKKKYKLIAIIALILIIIKPIILSSQYQSYMSQSIVHETVPSKSATKDQTESILSILQITGIGGIIYLLYSTKNSLYKLK